MTKLKALLLRIFHALGWDYRFYDVIEPCIHDWTPAEVVLPLRFLVSHSLKDGTATLTRYCTKCDQLEVVGWQSVMINMDSELITLQEQIKNANPKDFT